MNNREYIEKIQKLKSKIDNFAHDFDNIKKEQYVNLLKEIVSAAEDKDLPGLVFSLLFKASVSPAELSNISENRKILDDISVAVVYYYDMETIVPLDNEREHVQWYILYFIRQAINNLKR